MEHFRGVGRKISGVHDVKARPVNGHLIQIWLYGQMGESERDTIRDAMLGTLKGRIKPFMHRLKWPGFRVKTASHPKGEVKEVCWCIERRPR
ncbi:MAG TPA: hypothetical protein VFS75_00730 [Candidatus Paceibacterota bacterium]|nr:hypothetical protein [Candidatus Paceibacterota bacterium]